MSSTSRKHPGSTRNTYTDTDTDTEGQWGIPSQTQAQTVNEEYLHRHRHRHRGSMRNTYTDTDTDTEGQWGIPTQTQRVNEEYLHRHRHRHRHRGSTRNTFTDTDTDRDTEGQWGIPTQTDRDIHTQQQCGFQPDNTITPNLMYNCLFRLRVVKSKKICGHPGGWPMATILRLYETVTSTMFKNTSKMERLAQTITPLHLALNLHTSDLCTSYHREWADCMQSMTGCSL